MDADQLLASLGLATGLDRLAFDANGCARLVFDGRFTVNFEHDAAARAIQVYSVLAPVPREGREALFATLLQANLFGAATQGATLAVDGSTHEVVLCRMVPVEQATAASFAALVEAFVDSVEAWQERLAGGTAAAAATQPAGLAASPL
jgi:hypothetical protein